MKNVHNGLSVKNISDLIFKELYGVYETKISTKRQIKKYKMNEKEIFQKHANLSEDQLSEKSNKNVCVKNDVMTTVIKRYRGKNKKKIKKKEAEEK